MFETEITIVGVGQRWEGVKDGKRWVNQQIFFTYPDERVTGLNADKVTLWGDDVDQRSFAPGMTLHVWLVYGKDKTGHYGLRKMAIVA